MRWTCPKCGKKLDISNEQLISNDGVIVCPQCLLQARQPVPTARVAARYDEADAATATPPPYNSSKNTSTPPPYKPRMKQASNSNRSTGTTGNNGTSSRPTTPKRNTSSSSKKKNARKKNQSKGMSALGCFGRTIVITLLLFAAYVFFGLLLDAMQ